MKLQRNDYYFDAGNTIERSKFRYRSIKDSFRMSSNIMLPLHKKVEICKFNCKIYVLTYFRILAAAFTLCHWFVTLYSTYTVIFDHFSETIIK